MVSSNEYPTVDLSISDKDALSKVVKQACTSMGFFQVINHGISEDLLKLVRENAVKFFNLPVSTKKQYPLIWNSPRLQGYAGLGEETADVANLSLTGMASIKDLMESYQIGDIKNFPLEESAEGLPEELVSLQASMKQIYSEYRRVAFALLELVSLSLDLEPQYFNQLHDGIHRSILRVTKYPRLDQLAHLISPNPGDTVTRISPHRDLGSITLLFQDTSGGLQVQPPGSTDTWVDLPPAEGVLVVNLGNLLSKWTNYTYQSSIHRVVATPVAETTDRYSVIMFVNPNDDAEVSPLPATVDDEHPAAFRPFTVEEYMTCKLTQIFDPSAREFKGACEFDD